MNSITNIKKKCQRTKIKIICCKPFFTNKLLTRNFVMKISEKLYFVFEWPKLLYFS